MRKQLAESLFVPELEALLPYHAWLADILRREQRSIGVHPAGTWGLLRAAGIVGDGGLVDQRVLRARLSALPVER